MKVKFHRNWLLLVFLAGGVSLLMLVLYPFSVDHGDVSPEPIPVTAAKKEEPKIDRVEELLPRNSTVQGILLKFGFTHQDIHSLIEDVRPVYNLNRVRAGHRFAIERLSDGTFKRLEYHINDEEYLSVAYESDRYLATRQQHDFDVKAEGLYGVIRENLWKTLLSQGEKPGLVSLLYEILQWDIDFTLIQPGDSFKAILEKKFLNGEFVKYGDILAVQFNSGGRTFNALLFGSPGNQKRSYYDEGGKAVRKAFLKTPFSFDPRITSRFSFSRFHPILKRRRPHLGVDYAAPPRTPVLASASGSVVFAGRKGAYGKLLKVRHPNGYVTSYAHLSRIGVKVGQKVIQGQAIGEVGSTGLSTGPHLDYRVQDRSGKFINPQRVSVLPSDKPVGKRYWNEFVLVRDELLDRLTSVPEVDPFLKRLVQAD